MQQIVIKHLLKARCWSSSWEYSDVPKRKQILIKALVLVGTSDLYPLWKIEFCEIIFMLQNISQVFLVTLIITFLNHIH